MMRSTDMNRRAFGALISLSLAMLLSALGTSIANVGLPALAMAFEVPFQQVQWVILSYLLSITTLIVSVGRLGDMMGRRRVLLGGVLMFTASSALCGLAPTLWVLVAARTAQGAGAAIMMALAMAMAADNVPKGRTGSAMGMLGTMSAIGTALGPSLGGVLLAGIGWQALFMVNVPLGILTSVLIHRFLPPDRPAPLVVVGFDYAGTLLLGTGLAAYALAMTIGRGHFGAVNLALLSGAVLMAGLFILVQRRTASPLIRPELLRDPHLGAALAMNALVSTIMMATLVVGPFYLSRSLGLSPVQVGMVLSVGPLVVALAGVPAGRAVDRMGVSRMTLLGLASIVAGTALLALSSHHWGVIGYIPSLTVITAGYALFQAANNTGVMGGVAPDRRGVVSGLLNLSRNLGLVTGASVLGAVFAAAASGIDIAMAPPAVVATGMRVTFLVSSLLAGIAIAIKLCWGIQPGNPAPSATG